MPYRDLKKHRDWMKQYRDSHREQYNARMSTYRKAHPEKYLLCTCRNRAKSNGLEFNIDEGDVRIPEVCPVLGIPLHQSNKGFHEASPSIDRIDSTKGYVKGNVAVISFRANRMKQNATLQELKALVAWLEKVQPEPARQLTAFAAG